MKEYYLDYREQVRNILDALDDSSTSLRLGAVAIENLLTLARVDLDDEDEEDEEDLHQLRRVGEEHHIGAHHRFGPAWPIRAQGSAHKAQQHAYGKSQEGDLQRKPCTTHEIGQAFENG